MDTQTSLRTMEVMVIMSAAHDRYSFPTIEFRARYTVRLISRLQFDYCTAHIIFCVPS